MKKKILIGLGIIVIILLGAVAFLFSSLDSIVKKAIETVGSDIAGVPVTVGEVKLSLTEGKGTIRGLTIGNPSGYKAPSAFKLGEVSLTLDTGSVTKDPIVIKLVQVAAPEVTYEMGASGGSNVQTIRDNVQAKTAAKPAAGSSSSKDPGKKLIIDRLDITGGKVTLATSLPGVKGSGGLPDIHLTGIGRNSNGATASQVAEQVLGALSRSAMSAATSLGIGDALKGVTGAAGDTAGKAGDSLKGLLGK